MKQTFSSVILIIRFNRLKIYQAVCVCDYVPVCQHDLCFPSQHVLLCNWMPHCPCLYHQMKAKHMSATLSAERCHSTLQMGVGGWGGSHTNSWNPPQLRPLQTSAVSYDQQAAGRLSITLCILLSPHNLSHPSLGGCLVFSKVQTGF